MARMLGLGMCCGVALGILAGGAARADESASRGSAAKEKQIGTLVVVAPVPDSAITTAIENEMFARADLRNGSVSVTTDKGVVTLTGLVPSPEVRQTAVNLARHTNGVVLVQDGLRLAGNTPSDPEVPLR